MKTLMRIPQAASNRSGPTALPGLGWREWLDLPDLGLFGIKAKVDTGAYNCSLHASDLEFFEREIETSEGALTRVEFVRFTSDPNHIGAGRRDGERQRDESSTLRPPVRTEARIVHHRLVRNSGGERERRPVIETTLRLGTHEFLAEVNLTNRDLMGFRMLIGRRAMHGRFLVDPSASYLTGRHNSRSNSV